MDTLACTKCMWTGTEETINHQGVCPKCGSEVEYIDNNEYLPYQKPFNWNKK